MKGGEKIGAQDDHIPNRRIYNCSAPDLELGQQSGTVHCSNRNLHCLHDSFNQLTGENKKSPHIRQCERPKKNFLSIKSIRKNTEKVKEEMRC